jgi:hypothetical protein
VKVLDVGCLDESKYARCIGFDVHVGIIIEELSRGTRNGGGLCPS